MTEEIKQGDNGGLQPEPNKPKDVAMTITLTEMGQLSVQAPGDGALYDIPKCLYLMEIAKDHIKAANRAQSQARIMPAQPSMAQQVRGMFHRKH